jgi:hypothetical protein
MSFLGQCVAWPVGASYGRAFVMVVSDGDDVDDEDG